MTRIPPTTHATRDVRSSQKTPKKKPSPLERKSTASHPTAHANARFKGESHHGKNVVANAKYQGAAETSQSRSQKNVVANARFTQHQKNPFKAPIFGDPKPKQPNDTTPQPEDKQPKGPEDNNGFKFDARRDRIDPRFEKLGIAMHDPHGDYVRNVTLVATSGVQEKKGYGKPRSSSEFSIALMRNLKKDTVDSLSKALSKFSFRNIISDASGRLKQKPLYQHAEHVGGVKFKDSIYNMGSEANRAGVKNGDVKNIFLGACGNDGGNCDFKGEVNKVAQAFKNKFDAKNVGIINTPHWPNKLSVEENLRMSKEFKAKLKTKFKKIHDYALKHKDKAINLAFYYTGHGNWDHNGRKQGEATSSNQNFNEKEFKNMLSIFKDSPHVSIIPIFNQCHAGGMTV